MVDDMDKVEIDYGVMPLYCWLLLPTLSIYYFKNKKIERVGIDFNIIKWRFLIAITWVR